MEARHPGVLGGALLGVFEDDGVAATADERELERVEEVRLVRGRLVAYEKADDRVDARRVVREVCERRRAHVVGDDGDVVLRRLDDLL